MTDNVSNSDTEAETGPKPVPNDTPAISDNMPNAATPIADVSGLQTSYTERFASVLSGLPSEYHSAVIELVHGQLLTGDMEIGSVDYWEALDVAVSLVEAEAAADAGPDLLDRILDITDNRGPVEFMDAIIDCAGPGGLDGSKRVEALETMLLGAVHLATVALNGEGSRINHGLFMELCAHAWDANAQQVSEGQLPLPGDTPTEPPPPGAARDCARGGSCRVVDGTCVNCGVPE